MSREFLKAKAHAEIDRIFATGGVLSIEVLPEVADNEVCLEHLAWGDTVRPLATSSGVREELVIRIKAVYPTPKAPDA